eukprot:COSAG02_NODE_19816_length_863_cov_1.353403_1_plen_67_part_00
MRTKYDVRVYRYECRTRYEYWYYSYIWYPLDPDAPELSEIKTIPISIEFPKITKLIVFRRLKMISR